MTAPLNNALPPPLWATALGYAGLLPFIALALGAWLAPATYRAQAAFALLGYGTTIACFLGAVHWGLAMRSSPTARTGPWLWGVFPSLVAWLSLLMPLPLGLLTLALLLGICLAVDWCSYPGYGTGAWLTMRWHLSAVATVCLLAGAAAA